MFKCEQMYMCGHVCCIWFNNHKHPQKFQNDIRYRSVININNINIELYED